MKEGIKNCRYISICTEPPSVRGTDSLFAVILYCAYACSAFCYFYFSYFMFSTYFYFLWWYKLFFHSFLMSSDQQEMVWEMQLVCRYRNIRSERYNYLWFLRVGTYRQCSRQKRLNLESNIVMVFYQSEN